jgi:GNAT superfamily N-acetyltransferase
MEIRKARPDDDFKAIGNIYCCSWKTAYRGIVPQDYLDTLSGRHWSSVLADSRYDTYVMMDGGKYIGVSSVCAARDEKMADWGEICSFYLLPEYWGRGYAKLLFERVINALLDGCYQDIYLWVLNENIRARKFYKKHGFQPNGDTAVITIEGQELTEVRYIRHL